MAKRSKANDIRVLFGDAVRRHREVQRLTQEDLADRAGIHRTYLSDIERGSRNPSLINIARLAKGLMLTPSELFKGVELP